MMIAHRTHVCDFQESAENLMWITGTSGEFFAFSYWSWGSQDKSTRVVCHLLLQSVQFNQPVVSDYLWPHGLQHARLSRPSPTPGAYSNLYPSSWWCHPTLSSSVISFSSCPWSFPASGSFPMSHFFASGGQSMGASASASVLPMNIQYWFPLGLTGCISLQSKGLSRVFSNTTVQKHEFFSIQLSF